MSVNSFNSTFFNTAFHANLGHEKKMHMIEIIDFNIPALKAFKYFS